MHLPSRSDALALSTILIGVIVFGVVDARVYKRCELARELALKQVPEDQIGDWLCIAEHGSKFNSSAVNLKYKRFGGSAYYGIFQISDLYGCLKSSSICGLTCADLKDDEVEDDIDCMRRIYGEYSREIGDGFAAWPVHKTHCRNRAERLSFSECLNEEVLRFQAYYRKKKKAKAKQNDLEPRVAVGKVYDRCELAVELRDKYKLPQDQIATWVCIAYHESRFNTSAEGRLNADGSGDHGLFQISDIYWCSIGGRPGKACGVTCEDMRNSDISDDVRCIQVIFDEHRRISGNGFNAWTVYKPYCQGREETFIHGCFDASTQLAPLRPKPAVTAPPPSKTKSSLSTVGKVYDRCELAVELRDKYKLPQDQIATWVCIAYHESRFNTSAEGRLNADGSGDHGLFQISDIYWCSIGDRPGKACGVTCEDMRNSDISDDVRCIQVIFDEHRRISGNGFNAWTVYKPYCQGREDTFVHGCFDATTQSTPSAPLRPRPAVTAPPPSKTKSTLTTIGKVYDRCELANDLLHKFSFPMDQIATWVCIAYHESRFNTSAEGRLNADGSGDHGLFQISDIYWCSPPGNGWACGVTCDQLKDSDITDDVKCVRKIYDEHRRLSGDGFNAWSVYKPYCKGKSASFAEGCFGSDDHVVKPIIPKPAITAPTRIPPRKSTITRGKVYNKCELAKELHFKHHYSIEDSATWTCIAQYQSNFNTAAVSLGGGSVQYHGMFQLSDEYWCSPPGNGGVCGIPCSDLEDDDITDDLACMRHIYEEHQRISGDGFNAWTVYQPYCKGKAQDMIRECFDEGDNVIAPKRTTIRSPTKKKNVGVGKVYERCELARELYHTHNLPFEQIATWVCIAHRESNYNVSAIGRLNADGSEDHGLFQISDIYWCSPPGKGWVCGLSCSDLEDNDLTDDVECMKKIHEEHTRLSGDGFNAWAVYGPYCKGRSDHYIKGCFDKTTSVKPTTTRSVTQTTRRTSQTTRRTSFYSWFTTSTTKKTPTTKKATTSKKVTAASNYLWSPTTSKSTLPSKTSRSTTVPPTKIVITRSPPVKATTNLFDFYLNHFGRPNTTPATFASFTARTRSPPSTTASQSTWSSGFGKPAARSTRSTNRHSNFDQFFANIKHN